MPRPVIYGVLCVQCVTLHWPGVSYLPLSFISSPSFFNPIICIMLISSFCVFCFVWFDFMMYEHRGVSPRMLVPLKYFFFWIYPRVKELNLITINICVISAMVDLCSVLCFFNLCCWCSSLITHKRSKVSSVECMSVCVAVHVYLLCLQWRHVAIHVIIRVCLVRVFRGNNKNSMGEARELIGFYKFFKLSRSVCFLL